MSTNKIYRSLLLVGLAAAVAGPGLTVRGPVQSRVDLLADVAGVLNVRVADLERLKKASERPVPAS